MYVYVRIGFMIFKKSMSYWKYIDMKQPYHDTTLSYDLLSYNSVELLIQCQHYLMAFLLSLKLYRILLDHRTVLRWFLSLHCLKWLGLMLDQEPWTSPIPARTTDRFEMFRERRGELRAPLGWRVSGCCWEEERGERRGESDINNNLSTPLQPVTCQAVSLGWVWWSIMSQHDQTSSQNLEQYLYHHHHHHQQPGG